MLRDFDEFYETSLIVLNQLLETNQLSDNQYWNAMRALPLIEKHPSQLKTEEELTFLFVFGTISDLHPEYSHIEKILSSFGIDDSEIYLIVRNAMNIKPQIQSFFNDLDRQEKYKAKKRRIRSASKTIEAILDKIHNEELKKDIEVEVDLFIYQFSEINLKPTKKYFIVFLEKLARKYSSPITKDYLCSTFNVKPSGWMKMQKKMEEHGIEVVIETNPKRFVLHANKILGNMCDLGILSESQLLSANQLLEDIPERYPGIMNSSKNQSILIAFMSICVSSKMELVDITDMFINLDIDTARVMEEDKENRRKEYYQMFYQALQRE